MVITLYADRRTLHLADIALRLAQAFVRASPWSAAAPAPAASLTPPAAGLTPAAAGLRPAAAVKSPDSAPSRARVHPSAGVAIALPRSMGVRQGDGVHLVTLPDGVAATQVRSTLGALAARHAVTIVAWTGAPTEQALAVCDASDRVLVVSDSTVPSLRGTQRALKLCASLGYGLDKIAVVLHDFADDAPLAPAEAANVLKREIFWVIPGETAAADDRAHAFEALAARLAAESSTAAEG